MRPATLAPTVTTSCASNEPVARTVFGARPASTRATLTATGSWAGRDAAPCGFLSDGAFATPSQPVAAANASRAARQAARRFTTEITEITEEEVLEDETLRVCFI